MSEQLEHLDRPGTASHALRRALNALEAVRTVPAEHAEEVRRLRAEAEQQLEQIRDKARAEATRFHPHDVGFEMRDRLGDAFDVPPAPGATAPLPQSIAEAEEEWKSLVKMRWMVFDLISQAERWDRRFFLFRFRRPRPEVPEEVWATTYRLSAITASMPALIERAVAWESQALAEVHARLEQDIADRAAVVERIYAEARTALDEVQAAVGLGGASWGDERWAAAAPVASLQHVIRVGELEPRAPQTAGLRPVPAVVDFPFSSGMAISADVDHRAEAMGLVRSLVFRLLAAIPPGDARFVFLDPVSLGQDVAEFRHLAEFDQRLVDVKTWTSERDIEARLDELADHLEVVISNYLRGQFDSIDDYNRHAGEVAEPYRILVVLDYPSGFSERAQRQLLSIIENGPRCGVHTILAYDPAAPVDPHRGRDGVTIDRLIHSMQHIDVTRRRLTVAAPVGSIYLDLVVDPAPPIAFAADGSATTSFARLLLAVGGATRSSHAGPVTLERLLPVIGKLAVSGRRRQALELVEGASPIDHRDPATWWTGTTANGAFTPIGRAGAQDVAAMYFSSTEVAGGAVVVGVPRSGKSTALHAAIMSLSLFYSPDELELYLIDSKHGVEFKAYEDLPHARLVSINSEREFSVAVLQSLDREIARRAELMKRRTAGRTNITEYRQITGDRLPRVVLFMDEFHEVFEEDDALGQAAFQAFSNIVRQGPFAGVHVVLASQTLSSMPAMDRSTLSLLPMRVAFMCNESDADLVMGDANREVKALSQQGEGIFNPSRGDPAHNQPFRGLYVPPDERDELLQEMAGKAKAMALTRRPRVFDGDDLAVRSRAGVGGSSTRPAVRLGEPLSLEPSAGIALRRGRGAHVLLLGGGDQDGQITDGSLDGAMESCLLDAAAQGLDVEVVDFRGDDEPDGGRAGLVRVCEHVGARYVRGSAFAGAMARAAAEVQRRQENADYGLPGRLMVLNGIHRALDLVPDDPYADLDPQAREIATNLSRVLRDGPDVGVHAVVLVDALAQFDRRLGRETLKELEHRIVDSGVSLADIAAVTDSFTEGSVRRHQLLLVDYARGRTRRLRAYPRLTADDLSDDGSTP